LALEEIKKRMGEAVFKQNQQVGHRFAVMASWRVGGGSLLF
jgi:hypothetical protein